MYQIRDQLHFCTCVLLCGIRYFFHTDAFQSNKYDGETQKRKSSAGALQRGAALRLFTFASSIAVLKRIVFALVTSIFAHVYFFAAFVISSTRMPSSPTSTMVRHRKRKSCAGALQRGAALRLFPFASSIVVLNRIVFALVTMFISSFPDVDHLCVHPPFRTRHRRVGFYLFLFRARSKQVEKESFADSDLSSCVNLCTSWLLPIFNALCSSDSREVLRPAADCLANRRNC